MKYLPLGSSRSEIDFLKRNGVFYDKRTLKKLLAAYEYSHLPCAEDVCAFLSARGFEIVHAYVVYQCCFNGGRPDPCVLIFGKRSVSIQFFYAFFSPMDDFTLSFALDFFEDRMPLGFLPIAHDSGGGLLLLDCRVATAGRIFYWDHCCCCCDVNSLEYVCDSFGELENMFVQ